jgi:EmrB/QacA subfamily drug resistance transporter
MLDEKEQLRAAWWALAGVGLGVLMATLDSSIVNIALPTLTAAFETSFATVQWVVLSYSLVMTALTLGVARLGDMFGKKRVYSVGLIIFTLASLLCGLAPTVELLIAARVLQGIGGVATSALGVAIVAELFPASQRGKAIGMIGSVVSVGIALGPSVGGALIELAHWRAIFLVNLPIGLLTMFIVSRFVPERISAPRTGPRPRFDYLGVTSMAGALTAYAAAMTLAQEHGLTGWQPLSLMGIGLALGVVFVVTELRVAAPAVDLSIFRNRLFSLNIVMGLMVFIVLASNILLLPFFLEQVQGYSTMKAGLMLAVVPLMMGVVAPVSGMLSDRFGPRIISAIGLMSMTLGYALATRLELGMSEVAYLAHIAPIGIGFGMFQSPNNAAIMGAAQPERMGVVSGLLSLTRTVGSSTGIPLVGALFAGYVLATGGVAGDDFVHAAPAVLLGGIRQAFTVSAAIAACATLVALTAAWVAWRERRRG